MGPASKERKGKDGALDQEQKDKGKMPGNLSELVAAWLIKEPVQIEPLQQGTNNHVWRIDAVDGQSYVLRVLPGSEGLSRVRTEAMLLDALSKQQLQFRLPVLLKARNGDIVVPFEQETGASTMATLHPFLPGSKPDRNDPGRAEQAGAALAMLDNALAALPESIAAPREEGNPYHEPEVLVALESLPVDQKLSRQAGHLLDMARERVDELYRRLPQQWLHYDFVPSNLLVDNSGITAVLDFEFAGRDIRALDLCAALNWWPINLMGTGNEWNIIDAFGAAYLHNFPLSEEELQAIPDLLRLRDAGSLLHRIGRYLAGLESDLIIESRLKRSLWREEWLSANRDLLLRHVFSWTQ